MRIADSIMSNNYLSNLNRLKSDIDKLSGQISSSERIRKPSDDPTGAVKLLALNQKITQSNTYSENITNGQAFLQETVRGLENIQSEITSILVKVVELTDETKNDSLDTYADIIDMSLNAMLESANLEYDGKYLFGGTDFSDKPFGFSADNSSVEVKVSAVDGNQKIKISSGSAQKINISGTELFGVSSQGDQVDIFNTIISIRDNLRNGIKPTETEYQVLEQFNKDILDNIAGAGNTMVRLDNTNDMLTNQKLLLEGLMEKENSVDIAKAVVDLQNLDYLLQLSYKTSAMILQKSLMNYL